MTRYKLLIGATATALVLSALPASAQRPGGGAGSGGADRPSGGGGGGGGGNSGGGGGGGFGGGSSSGGSSGGSGGSMSSPSGGGGHAAPSRPSDAPSRSNPRADAPERRGGGGGGDRERAVPRGGESRGTSRVGSSSAGSGDHTNDRTADRAADRAVPAYSRPREGRPVSGSVAERQTPIRGRNDGYIPYYYNTRYYGWPTYGLGLGYFAYDPLWFDPYADPYYYGGGGYGGGYSGSGGYGYQGSQAYRDTGSLRLKIKPREAKVFIDGYFVGVVDSFDGLFQKLGLESGGHRVEIRADGYEPLQFEVLITPGEAVTYKGEMKRTQ